MMPALACPSTPAPRSHISGPMSSTCALPEVLSTAGTGAAAACAAAGAAARTAVAATAAMIFFIFFLPLAQLVRGPSRGGGGFRHPPFWVNRRFFGPCLPSTGRSLQNRDDQKEPPDGSRRTRFVEGRALVRATIPD